MRFRPSFEYTIKDAVKSAGIFLLVICCLLLLIPLITTSSQDDVMFFSVFTFSACIFSFVSGIVSIREYLRLGIQHGISRRTTFLSLVLASLLQALLLSLAGEILLTLGQMLWTNPGSPLYQEGLYYVDLYQLFYANEDFFSSLSLLQHLEAISFQSCTFLATQAVGALISLAFYRLNKVGKLVLAIGGPVLLFNIPSWLMMLLPADSSFIQWVTNLFTWMGLSSWNWALFSIIAAVVLFAFDWLLCRRASITPAKS